MRALLAILIGIVGVTLAGCGDEWDGHVYPDKTDLTQSEYIGRFSSLKECRSGALARISLLHDPQRADYECGRIW